MDGIAAAEFWLGLGSEVDQYRTIVARILLAVHRVHIAQVRTDSCRREGAADFCMPPRLMSNGSLVAGHNQLDGRFG